MKGVSTVVKGEVNKIYVIPQVWELFPFKIIIIITTIMEAIATIIIEAKSDCAYFYLAHSTALGSYGWFELELSSLS